MKKIKFSTILSFLLWLLAVVALAASCAYPSEYRRDAFRHWSDLDHNGLNTRQDIVRALQMVSYVWACPYTGKVFARPQGMDVDHVVPLAWAWRHGADQWTDAMREQFANDHENLELVAAAVNRSKGDQGPESWLPPNLSYAVPYIRKFRDVCKKYELACDDGFYASLEESYLEMSKGVKP